MFQSNVQRYSVRQVYSHVIHNIFLKAKQQSVTYYTVKQFFLIKEKNQMQKQFVKKVKFSCFHRS